MRNVIYMDSPIGKLSIVSEDDKIIMLKFGITDDYVNLETEVLKLAREQLIDYFNGKLKNFTLPLKFYGTDFQKKVWNALMEIPYGVTKSYGEIASNIGNPKACRAVGLANSKNPIAIIAPCHRVIGKNGKLTGFAGGLDIKEKLLYIESVL